ncbi:TPA: hypothetical protein ACGXQD_005342 [Bacillus cereus]|uniref:hypothetical protein n=2 Tax=Bacillus cereus group TaxID=86661 RepID=UPI002B39F59A|nr:hypothetical protein [Bacillus cereus]MDA1769565.1 hypothetical protein [Bacillus cereus]HEQ3529326.1 hypothetical protein [Bacillus cereus]
MHMLYQLQSLQPNKTIVQLKLKAEKSERRNLIFLQWDEKNQVAVFFEKNRFLFVNYNEIERMLII